MNPIFNDPAKKKGSVQQLSESLVSTCPLGFNSKRVPDPPVPPVGFLRGVPKSQKTVEGFSLTG